MRTICSICGSEFEGYGNNPYPVRLSSEARCCDKCDGRYVLPIRMFFNGVSKDNPNRDSALSLMALQMDLMDTNELDNLVRG